MMRFLAILLVALLVVAAICAGWWIRQGDRAPRGTVLSDGHEVRVLALLPSEQGYDSDAGWRGSARRWLPGPAQRLLPQRVSGQCGSGTNSATLYVEVRTPGGGPAGTLPWDSYYAGANDGFLFGREGGYCSFGGAAVGGQIYGLTLRSFPRRQREFEVVFPDRAGGELGRLRVKNPFPGPFAEWTPEPLPSTRTNGPVMLTLLGGTIEGDPRWRGFRPRWHVEATELHWRSARAGWATLSDATGNEGPLLSPRELAWKVTTRVHRQNWEDFLPGERLIWTGLPAPGEGEVFAGEREGVCSDAQVKLVAVSDAGTLYFTNGVLGGLDATARSSGHASSHYSDRIVERWGSQDRFMLIEVRGIGWEDEVRFRLRDDSGREVQLLEGQGSHGLRGGGGRGFLRRFARPEEGATLTLEVVVSRPLQFEFMVNPAEVSPPK